MSRVPLAWKNLTAKKLRLLWSVAGVTFAVVLMFVQYGFKNALIDSTAMLLTRLDADLFVVSRLYQTLSVPQPFTRRRVTQALQHPAVATAHPVFVETYQSVLRNIDPGRKHMHRSIRAIGFEPDDNLLKFQDNDAARLADLKISDHLLFDQLSKSDSFGQVRPGLSQRVELAGKPVTVSGLFHLGTDFSADGNVVMGSGTFGDRFRAYGGSSQPLGMVDIGALRLKPHAKGDLENVAKELMAALPGDVQVLTKQQFVGKETKFWDDSTPIGGIFNVGMFLGFAVGIVFCFQILSTEVSDHLAEFATLKAMGYTSSFLVGTVLQEALYLALLGFVPGTIVSWLVYQFLNYLTGLPMLLTPPRAALILGLTILMCMAAGLLAVQKVIRKDPAEVF